MSQTIITLEDCKLISCNKYKIKSDYHCRNLNPEGTLSNGLTFVNLGEVMYLKDESGKFLKALYHDSQIKKTIMDQFAEWKE